MFARPLPVSPPLHDGALSPLTCAPELPPPHHDELPLEPGVTSGGSLLLEAGQPSHLRSDSHRSPSPTNLEVHLSLASPFEQDKRSRIYSGPNVTTNAQPYAPLAPPPPAQPTPHYNQLASLPLVSEGSAQSTTSNASLDSVNFTRRKSLALSVSDLMGPSMDQTSGGSRPSTSAGVMGFIGEKRGDDGLEDDEEEGRLGGGGGLVTMMRPATSGQATTTSWARVVSQ